MRYFATILLLGLVLLSKPADAEYGIGCENCTDSQYFQCARDIAETLPPFNPDVAWVLDFPNGKIKKYQIWSEDTSRGEESNERGWTIGFAQALTPSAYEQDLIDGTLNFVNGFLRPHGLGQIFSNNQCNLSNPSSAADQHQKSDGDIGIRTITEAIEYEVPENVAESAFDVIRNHGLGIDIGQDIIQQFPDASYMDEAASFLLNLNDVPLNINTVFRVKFADGSVGIWKYDGAFERWAPDKSTFEDSEGNSIPESPSDPTGQTYEFGPDPGSYDSMVGWLQLLGWTVTGSGGANCQRAIVCVTNGDFRECVSQAVCP